MERFDFYSDVVFVFIAYSCHWEWANASAVVLVIATFGQAVGMAVGAGDETALLAALLGVVAHPSLRVYSDGTSLATVAGHALARVVLEDLPQAEGGWNQHMIIEYSRMVNKHGKTWRNDTLAAGGVANYI